MKRLDGQERRRDSGPDRELVLRPDIIKYIVFEESGNKAEEARGY